MSSIAKPKTEKPVSSWIILILAIACGVIVANLYYAQPLVGPISSTLGLSSGAAGLIVTLTQIGYGIGLLFIVPLGDILENRKLVVTLLLFTAVVLAIAAVVKSAMLFLATSLFIGLGSVAAQVLVPYAAHLSPDATRGRDVGNVMSGLLLGIMLARPISSMVAEFMGWRAIFVFSAAIIFILTLVLVKLLPTRQPMTTTQYPTLLRSMLHLLKTTPVLQRRAIYHFCVFGTFSLFWTTVPLLLTGPIFNFSQKEVALFALVGVSGAVAAPVAGRLADKGWIRPATGLALALVIISVILPTMIQSGSTIALVTLVVSAIILDMGVSANLVLGQRAIFSLGAEIRSRLNGLYMAIFFAGGAIGSATGAWAYAMAGWKAALLIGIALPTIAMIYFATEKK
ncbi:MFS transporter [Lysinibacillus xylanilyticus]|uniref:MFS transporter n=1 Tax=Lysinibacillus xylanilyticus TaxID=582475 RepID=A0ABT4EWD5_9BACI|nr:MFS transporter [Lysinibacillus xylanilyticus]MCY9549920.1 MFS transporter [Lysinibacillus xylanilyticus]MED3803905.1 MFS transporter [Lysinibacillus xylanilyticus]